MGPSHNTLPLRLGALTLGLLCFGGSLTAAARADGPASPSIDRLLATAWQRARAQPAAVADDAEFVRRIYLDLVGRIPTRDEAEHFINDRTPHKRARRRITRDCSGILPPARSPVGASISRIKAMSSSQPGSRTTSTARRGGLP